MPLVNRALALLALAVPLGAEPAALSLHEVLALAEANSARLSASKFREAAAESSIGIARAGYLPTLEFDEMDSSRFPESGRTTGVGGLIGDPYRSGRASVTMAKGTLWDFGRTSSGVEAARQEARYRREDTEVARAQVDEAALLAYYDCSRYRTQRDTLLSLSKEIELVAEEVNRFVKTGQTSVVARYLVDAQSEEAETERADFDARLNAVTRRLAVLTGLPQGAIACPGLPERADAPLPVSSGAFASPLLTRAQADAEAARAKVEQAKSGHYPRLLAAGTAGSLDAAGVKDKGAYAFAAGVSLPLFDGLRTTNEVGRAKAVAAEKDKELDAARQRLDDANARYDEVIESCAARLAHLSNELKLAQEGFDLAKKRYKDLQGDVIDLREALRNLMRTRIQINDLLATSLKAQGAKSLLNGGAPLARP